MGLIFVDAVTPLQQERFSPEVRAADPEISTSKYYMISMVYALGIPRVLGACSKIPARFEAGFEQHTERTFAEVSCDGLWGEIWKEYKSMHSSGEETVHTGPYGDLPILIFSQDPQKPSGTVAPPGLDLEESAEWNQMQEDLKKLSTRSRRLIFRGIGHDIPVEKADLLNKEVIVFIRQIRNEVPQPTDYGSTKTE